MQIKTRLTLYTFATDLGVHGLISSSQIQNPVFGYGDQILDHTGFACHWVDTLLLTRLRITHLTPKFECSGGCGPCVRVSSLIPSIGGVLASCVSLPRGFALNFAPGGGDAKGIALTYVVWFNFQALAVRPIPSSQ